MSLHFMNGHGAAIEQVIKSVVFELKCVFVFMDLLCLFRLVKFKNEEDCFSIYYYRYIFSSDTAIDRSGIQSSIKKYAQTIDTNPNQVRNHWKRIGISKRRHLNDVPANL